jgi:hypothetical protein
VLLPDLSAKEQEREARDAAREEEVEAAAVAGPVGVLAEQAAPAEGTAEAYKNIARIL